MNVFPVDSLNIKILLNLLQAYEAEFSAITKKTPRIDGIFPIDTPIDGDHPSFLVYSNSIPVGFCIKSTYEGIHDIAEFYVVPSFRYLNIGENFAKYIFTKYPGKWQVRQIEGAHKATRFWNKVINNFTSGNYTESIVNDSYWGKVTKQNFESH